MNAAMPSYFISHGGGPWPWMDSWRPRHAALEAALRALPQHLPERPAAVLVVSAHWEAPVFTVSASAAPPMLYDYHGFPENTYHVSYPAPGSPPLASRVRSLLEAAGLPVASDAARGLDHAAFVPLAIMYPEADVPVVQLSLRGGFEPAEHLAVGRALAPLRDESVLILGSGLSFHNLNRFGPAAAGPSRAFDGWLQDVLVAAPSASRTASLLAWTQAPAAREAHPREEHLLPLMVAVGAAETEPGRCDYHETDFFGSAVVSNFRFGG